MRHLDQASVSDRKIFTEFARRRAVITRTAVSLGVAMGLVTLLGIYHIVPMVSTVVFLGLGFAYGAIVNVRIWRCPDCKAHLGKLYFGIQQPKHCPGCGVQLIAD